MAMSFGLASGWTFSSNIAAESYSLGSRSGLCESVPVCEEAGIKKGLGAHGPRGAGAIRLANEGCIDPSPGRTRTSPMSPPVATARFLRLRDQCRRILRHKSLRILRIDARVRLVSFGVVRRQNVLVGERKAFGHGADGSGY